MFPAGTARSQGGLLELGQSESNEHGVYHLGFLASLPSAGTPLIIVRNNAMKVTAANIAPPVLQGTYRDCLLSELDCRSKTRLRPYCRHRFRRVLHVLHCQAAGHR